MTTDDRMALRRAGAGSLDDVFVKDVSMFRAEMLDSDHLWLCCYLPGTGLDGDRVTFEVVARGNRLEFTVVEMPSDSVSVEPSAD
ncbi:MAG TPA: hypothetical protein VH439_04310 [Gemmatimonadales bacterium]